MGATAEIYLATDASPEEVARVLARAIPNGELTHEPDFDEPFVAQVFPDGSGWIGGAVHRNDLSSSPLEHEASVDQENLSVDDMYPVVWVLKESPKDELALRRISVDLFHLLAGRLTCALLMTFDVDVLVMASMPGEGVTRFPAGVTPYPEDHEVWSRFRRVCLNPLE